MHLKVCLLWFIWPLQQERFSEILSATEQEMKISVGFPTSTRRFAKESLTLKMLGPCWAESPSSDFSFSHYNVPVRVSESHFLKVASFQRCLNPNAPTGFFNLSGFEHKLWKRLPWFEPQLCLLVSDGTLVKLLQLCLSLPICKMEIIIKLTDCHSCQEKSAQNTELPLLIQEFKWHMIWFLINFVLNTF